MTHLTVCGFLNWQPHHWGNATCTWHGMTGQRFVKPLAYGSWGRKITRKFGDVNKARRPQTWHLCTKNRSISWCTRPVSLHGNGVKMAAPGPSVCWFKACLLHYAVLFFTKKTEFLKVIEWTCYQQFKSHHRIAFVPNFLYPLRGTGFSDSLEMTCVLIQSLRST